MRIAQIAPLTESVPPTLYGGTERVVSWLTEELVRQGHDVTLFASGDSKTAANLLPITRRALRLNPEVKDYVPYHLIMLDQVASRADEFDVLHFHIDMFHCPLFRHMADRVLTTMHGRLDLPDLKPFYRAFPDMPLVSISDHQRKPMPQVNWAGTIYHGLPAELHRAQTSPGDYLAFLGRISPEKGPERAIAIATQAGVPLKIAAKVDVVDRVYYEERVRPLIEANPLVEYVGEIGESKKTEFLGNARALIFPIAWPEPFGLVMIEAMACGTPVIAYRHGSVPEVVEDGVTGFVVDDVRGAVDAVSRIGTLDRKRIRAEFDARFTAERMASSYVDIYARLVASREDAFKAA